MCWRQRPVQQHCLARPHLTQRVRRRELLQVLRLRRRPLPAPHHRTSTEHPTTPSAAARAQTRADPSSSSRLPDHRSRRRSILCDAPTTPHPIAYHTGAEPGPRDCHAVTKNAPNDAIVDTSAGSHPNSNCPASSITNSNGFCKRRPPISQACNVSFKSASKPPSTGGQSLELRLGRPSSTGCCSPWSATPSQSMPESDPNPIPRRRTVSGQLRLSGRLLVLPMDRLPMMPWRKSMTGSYGPPSLDPMNVVAVCLANNCTSNPCPGCSPLRMRSLITGSSSPAIIVTHDDTWAIPTSCATPSSSSTVARPAIAMNADSSFSPCLAQ